MLYLQSRGGLSGSVTGVVFFVCFEVVAVEVSGFHKVYMQFSFVTCSMPCFFFILHDLITVSKFSKEYKL
jgi:hypothetical protein